MKVKPRSYEYNLIFIKEFLEFINPGVQESEKFLRGETRL